MHRRSEAKPNQASRMGEVLEFKAGKEAESPTRV